MTYWRLFTQLKTHYSMGFAEYDCIVPQFYDILLVKCKYGSDGMHENNHVGQYS